MADTTQSFNKYYDRIESGEQSDEAYAAEIARAKDSMQADDDLIDYRREELR